MLDILQIFNSLQVVNDSTSQNAQFSAKPIPGYEQHRIGRDTKGNPSLLVHVFEVSEKAQLASIVLEYLTVQHDLDCRISHPDGITESGKFTIIRCTSTDIALRNYFLRIVGVVIVSLGNLPSKMDITYAIDRLVELFRAMTAPPRKTVQGLWAELFLIARSRESAKMVNAWHSMPEDRYDFSDDNQRIEVKSASGRIRQHHFSLEQLCPPTTSHLLIASMFVERTGAGTSMLELTEQIRSRIKDNLDLLFQLDRIVALTLGNDWRSALEERFDYQLAEESLAFFELSHIPMVNPNLPLGVSNVHFKSDLTGRPTADIAHYRSQGRLFQATLRRR